MSTTSTLNVLAWEAAGGFSALYVKYYVENVYDV
jgi:hypothetical protein